MTSKTPNVRTKVQPPATFARFCLNARTPEGMDRQIRFNSLRFQRWMLPTSDDFIEGAAMGPGGPKPIRKHRQQGFPLWEGAKIIPVKMNLETGDTVPIRKFKIPGTNEVRLFLDRGSFNPKKDDVEAHIGPYQENRRFVWEVTTGDPYQEETTFQVIAAGLLDDHGSVPYTPGLKAIVDAPSAAQGLLRRPKRKKDEDDRFTKSTEARLIKDMEDTGQMVKGVFMWWTRGWELEWSMEDSEEILVLDYDFEEKRLRAFRLRAIAGIGGVEEVNPKRYVDGFRERILQPVLLAEAA